jgi:hypothetical protein
LGQGESSFATLCSAELSTYTDEKSRNQEGRMTIKDKTLSISASRWRLIKYSLFVACLLISASLILGESGVGAYQD